MPPIRHRLIVSICLGLGVSAPGPLAAQDIVVFAAASLRTALDEIAGQWQSDTGQRVTVSYAGSSVLARQIMAGAPADIFLSASPEWMDAVQHEGMVVDGTRRDLLSNRLVLIGDPAMTPVAITPQLDLAGMLGTGWLAMGLVNSVPVGQYGMAALQSLELWDSISAQVAQADNARAALALTALGGATLGIVYATDAEAEPAVQVLGVFPESSHPAITYPVALLTNAQDPADRAFLDALSAPAAREVFAAQGFSPIEAP